MTTVERMPSAVSAAGDEVQTWPRGPQSDLASIVAALNEAWDASGRIVSAT